MNDFEALLRQSNLRITASRRAVFMTLKKATQPLSLSDIAARCIGVDRSSVYRTIDTYVAIGVVKTVHIGWKKQYELAELFSPHHHHFRCTVCTTLTHIADGELENAIESISTQHGFMPTAHHFEIEGVCRECQIEV